MTWELFLFNSCLFFQKYDFVSLPANAEFMKIFLALNGPTAEPKAVYAACSSFFSANYDSSILLQSICIREYEQFINEFIHIHFLDLKAEPIFIDEFTKKFLVNLRDFTHPLPDIVDKHGLALELKTRTGLNNTNLLSCHSKINKEGVAYGISLQILDLNSHSDLAAEFLRKVGSDSSYRILDKSHVLNLFKDKELILKNADFFESYHRPFFELDGNSWIPTGEKKINFAERYLAKNIHVKAVHRGVYLKGCLIQ